MTFCLGVSYMHLLVLFLFHDVTSLHPHSFHRNDCSTCIICRTESRKNIMSRRMDDALTLMEDILSTELPSPSLHPTTYKQSATSRVSSSNRGSNYGGPIMRQTISGTPMNFHAKPMGMYVCCCVTCSLA